MNVSVRGEKDKGKQRFIKGPPLGPRSYGQACSNLLVLFFFAPSSHLLVRFKEPTSQKRASSCALSSSKRHLNTQTRRVLYELWKSQLCPPPFKLLMRLLTLFLTIHFDFVIGIVTRGSVSTHSALPPFRPMGKFF